MAGKGWSIHSLRQVNGVGENSHQRRGGFKKKLIRKGVGAVESCYPKRFSGG